MKVKARKRSRVLVAVGIASVLMVTVFLLFVKSVSTAMWNRSLNSIVELTVQGSAAVSANLEKNLGELAVFSEGLQNFPPENDIAIRAAMSSFSQRGDFAYLALVDATGKGYTQNGASADYSAETQFKRLLDKKQGISEPFYDPVTGRKVLAMHCSLKWNGMDGKVLGIYFSEDMYATYAPSFFGGAGFSYVINSAGDLMLTYDRLESNKTFTNIFEMLSSSQNNPAAIRDFMQALESGKSGAVTFRHKDFGAVFGYTPMKGLDGWYTLFVVPQAEVGREINAVVNRALTVCLVIFAMFVLLSAGYIKVQRRYRQELEKAAFYDTLTGVRNFDKFRIDAPEIIAQNKESKYAMVYYDIRNFKYINDFFGYESGDSSLKYFSTLLSRDIKENELFARVSADKFVALYRYENPAHVPVRCAVITERLSEFEDTRQENYKIRLCSGIYLLADEENLSMNEMLDRANMARKSIKDDRSSDSAFYTEGMRQQLLNEKRIESCMEDALRNEEFIVYLQPKFNIRSESPTCAEALVRWMRPGRGLIPPMDFIPLFEQNRFIIQLDRYVFEQVCSQLRAWIDEGRCALPVSVNVSRVQLYSGTFVEIYEEIKNRYEIPDKMIELEFTESIVFEDTEYLCAIVGRLHNAGFLCSMDDFGKGYSSLNLLKELPVDVLKLDSAFFQEGESNSRGRVVVASIVDMARRLSMSTVAEGVESHSQVDFLRGVGCDLVQGFVYAKPMPMADFERAYLPVESEKN